VITRFIDSSNEYFCKSCGFGVCKACNGAKLHINIHEKGAELMNTLIINARLINEGTVMEADLRIKDQRIAKIAATITPTSDDRVMDAKGKLLLPGVIDDQVHFREPGLTHKADLQTETRAAAAGGITSVMEMPNTIPATLTSELLEAKYARAAQVAAVNYAFYLGASNDNLADVQRLDPNAAAGVKVFMGASTGNMLVDNERTLEGIFRDAPCLVATHCEYQPAMDAALQAAVEQYGDDIPVREHPNIRSREACLRSSELAVGLAKRFGTRLHVLHITTAEELNLFKPGHHKGKRITAETCVHYLHFDARDYDRLGNQIKCNPAIKNKSDQDALIAALHDGRIDVLATDHAPHTWEEKQRNYKGAPGGLPLVQHALVLALQRVSEGRLSYPMVVDKFCHAPAELYDVRERGYLREGYFADLALVDPHSSRMIERKDVLSKCGWSPFEGERFNHFNEATWVNGVQVWDGAAVLAGVHGMRLRFDRR
jgi:dihydroorotase